MMRRQRRREQHVRQTYNDTAARYEQTDEGLLEPETPTERTHKTQQKAIVEATSANAAANAWRKALPKGPYGINVARTGRHAVCYGAGGRVEVLDLHRNVRTAEVRCGEVCRAATFLHDETMVAVAQRKYVYVYDQDGAEVHRMAKHLEPEHLSYLPFHFLLASAGHAGWLKYNDVSTGQFVAEHNTKAGAPRSLAQNPQTAVLCLGHGNGVCSLWSPAQSKPLARLLCHRGAVPRSVLFTPSPRRRPGRVGAPLRHHRSAAPAASGPSENTRPPRHRCDTPEPRRPARRQSVREQDNNNNKRRSTPSRARSTGPTSRRAVLMDL